MDVDIHGRTCFMYFYNVLCQFCNESLFIGNVHSKCPSSKCAWRIYVLGMKMVLIPFI